MDAGEALGHEELKGCWMPSGAFLVACFLYRRVIAELMRVGMSHLQAGSMIIWMEASISSTTRCVLFYGLPRSTCSPRMWGGVDAGLPSPRGCK